MKTKKLLLSKIDAYFRLMRFDKPVGILLLLWPTWISLFFAAKGIPPINILVIFTLGVIVMRSAGCVINDYADKDFDKHVQRTKDRPITSNRVSPREALILFAVLLFTAFILVLQTNKETILLSFVGVALAIIYPFSKRYTHFPQVVLGATFAWCIPMSYSVLGITVDMVAYILYFATVVWSTIYDTMYAMVDRDDDIKLGIKSTAIYFGKRDIAFIVGMQIVFLLSFISIGIIISANMYYYLGVFAAFSSILNQQTMLLTRRKENYFKAFLNNNLTGISLLIGVVLNYI